MLSIMKEAKKDFDDFYNNNEAYVLRVERVNQLFGLGGMGIFRSNLLPTYYVGDIIGKDQYVVLGLNPGFDEKKNELEQQEKSGTWNRCKNFERKFFKFSQDHGWNHPYYRKLSKICCAIEKSSVAGENYLDFCHRKIVNIDLIPYHAKFFRVNLKNDEQGDYLMNQLDKSLSALKEMSVKFCLIHGKVFKQLLIDQGYLQKRKIKISRPIMINSRVNMFTFKIGRVHCLLFDKFLTQSFFGLRRVDFENNIPDEIKKVI